MPKFANVVTIEVAPGQRGQVVTLLAAHKARVKKREGNPSIITTSSMLSAFGTKRTSNHRPAMSAFGGKADITQTSENVR